MQDQGLSGYSAAPLTSSAPLRLGKCRVSWVGLGYAFRPSGAAATDTPRLASSRYRLARLRADRTLPVHLCLIPLAKIFVVVVVVDIDIVVVDIECRLILDLQRQANREGHIVAKQKSSNQKWTDCLLAHCGGYCCFTVDSECPVNRDGHIRAKHKSSKQK